MNKYIRIVVLSFVLLVGYGYDSVAGNLDLYKITDTIPIKNVNKSKLYKGAIDWIQKEKAMKLIRSNPEEFVVEGKGFLLYYNHVNLEDIFLSPRAGERTNGTIVYSVRVTILDSIVIAEYSNFTHDAYFSEFGKISFGTLYSYDNVPPGKCMENKIWCNTVWKEMKKRSEEDVRDHSTRLVADEFIRKKGKVFKVEKEVTKKEEKKEDPEDYLKLDSYLNQDEEADTNKAIIIK